KLSNGDTVRQWREEKPHCNLQPKKRESLESPALSETQGASQPPTDWKALAHSYAKNLTPTLRTELANRLGIPENAILPLTGYLAHAENTSQGVKEIGSWTFPEYDGHGRIIGITRRWRSGDKKMISGGHRGLSLPADSARFDSSYPLFVVEGASDVMALNAL